MAGALGVRRLLLTAAVAFLLGCQQSPTPGPAQAPVGSLTLQFKGEGDALAARGDYAAAAVKYQAAVNQEPGNVSLWFALGTAFSHLGRRQETIEAFGRVSQLGQPDSQEVQVARRWLVSAGVLSESASVAPQTSASGASTPYSGPTGAVKGNTEWKGVTPENLIAVKLILAGDEPATQKRSFASQIRLGQPYAFENVPPGGYRLTAYAGQTQLWEERVTVQADQQTVLDLSPTKSQVSPDQFPGQVSKDDGDFHKDYDRYEHARPIASTPPPAGEQR